MTSIQLTRSGWTLWLDFDDESWIADFGPSVDLSSGTILGALADILAEATHRQIASTMHQVEVLNITLDGDQRSPNVHWSALARTDILDLLTIHGEVQS